MDGRIGRGEGEVRNGGGHEKGKEGGGVMGQKICLASQYVVQWGF